MVGKASKANSEMLMLEIRTTFPGLAGSLSSPMFKISVIATTLDCQRKETFKALQLKGIVQFEFVSYSDICVLDQIEE